MSDRARQKKLEKQKKKRADAKARQGRSARSGSEALRALVSRAATSPPGEAWASTEWREETPALVTVVVSRKLPDGALVCAIALVDRTSVGIKNGHVRGPLRGKEVDAMLAQLGRINPKGMESVDDRTARSILHHAVRYAKGLGFEPHPDFPLAFLGEGDDLEETPLAKPARPVYLAEPDDDAPGIVAQLTAAVGEGNFDVHVPDDALAGTSMVLDRYQIGTDADAEGVLAIVGTLEGAHHAEGAEGVSLRRPGGPASAHVEDGALVVLAGSDAVAAGLRREIEAVLGTKVLFDRRERLSGREVLARLGSDDADEA